MKSTKNKREYLIQTIKANVNVQVENQNGFDFFTYEKTDGKFCLAVVSEKAGTALFWFHYNNESNRNTSLEYYKNLIQQRVESKKKSAEAKKERKLEASKDINEGDILVSSWGYDQTNIDYYKVIEKKAMTVKLQKVYQSISDCWNGGGKTTPTGETFGEIFTKRINAGYIKISDCQYAYKWSGKAETFTNYA